MRLIDYLETRDDVDPRRTGLIGFSKGGIETYLAAAADPRIAAAVPCIGVQSFRWGLENGQYLAYRSAQADEKFALRIQENTGHAVTDESREAAIEWLVKWLKQ